MTDETAITPDDNDLSPDPAPLRRPGRPLGYRPPPRSPAPVREEPRSQAAPQEGRLTRTRKRTEDKFHIDVRKIPPGWSWEWKRSLMLGKPDPFYMNDLRENHWTPVDGEKYPGMVVEQDGMILMQRPSYLTKEALQEGAAAAYDQLSRVQNQAAATPQGHAPRKLSQVRSAYDIALPGGDVGVPIPDDE